MNSVAVNKTPRLASIDALRGLSMFLLVCVGPVFAALSGNSPCSAFFSEGWGTHLAGWMHHCAWEGFVLWDLLMPLFLFTAGLSIPFQFAKYRTSEGNPSYGRIYLRIFRRVLLLWILGMIAQGNLLDLKWEGLRLYSNTLQTIAVGYLFASILYLHFPIKVQIAVCIALLAAYWAAMGFLSADGFGAGSYARDTNLCEWVDRTVLGRWRDGVSFAEDGSWAFSESYRYTWILSSLTFIATALTGVFAGELVRRNPTSRPENTSETSESETSGKSDGKTVTLSGHQVFARLLILGGMLLVLGWCWARIPEGVFGYCPMNKIIWTPSMVLWSSGWSTVLLAIFYEIIDVLHFRRGSLLLIVPGMNSIAAYMLPVLVSFQDIARRDLRGLEAFTGAWFPVIAALGGVTILWLILYFMYRTKTFLRV